MQNHFSCQQMCLQSICFRRVVCSHSCLRAVRGDDSWNHSSSVFHRGCGVLSMGSCARAIHPPLFQGKMAAVLCVEGEGRTARSLLFP